MSSTTPLRSVMTTDVVTVTADVNLAAAADVLADRGIGAAPVVDDAGLVVGLLRDEDLLSSESRLHLPTTIAILGVNFTLPGEVARYDAELRKAIASTVGEVMEQDFPQLPPDATLEDAATLMHEADVTHVVIVDDGRVAGIVARGDLVRHLAREHVSSYRPTRVEIDLDAIRHNVGALRVLVAPAAVMAVVKADAYGHGAVPVARAAVDAGAAALGVALVEEGVELRDAGVDVPILVLSEPRPEAAGEVVARHLTPVVYTEAGIDALAKAVADRGAEPLAVHLKLDTGMHRVGAHPTDAVPLVRRVTEHRELRLGGVCTHFAVADEPDDAYTRAQIERFDAVRADLAAIGVDPHPVHAANSAAAIGFPEARYDLVRVGIAIYGVPPAPGVGTDLGLRPALALRSAVSHTKRLRAGDRVSYGLRYTLRDDATVATVPIGYADGVPRNLAATDAEVVIRGTRCRIAGTVTMDQLMVDVGDLPVEVGDTVTLLGRDGDAEVTAEEWARRLGTIGYEIVCGIGPRVPRSHR